jgi:hypothetical protein
MKNFVSAALSYAEKGYLVFPCKPKSKEPATKNGFYDATTDEEAIREWWARNPNYNVAIRTGKESSLVVLDVDEGGEQTLKDNGWNAAATVTIKTGKGFHHYYNHPGGNISTKVRLAEGIDVKAEGGYVLAPPSVHPNGTAYEWIIGPQDATIADAPEWLLTELTQAPERSRVSVTVPIANGERNSELTRRAGLLTRVFDHRTAREVLHFINHRYCEEPLPDDEVDRITLYENAVDETDDEVGVLMSDVTAERVEWLWDGRIPLGKLTVLDGDPGLGKSLITMDLAARVTTGRAFPHGDVDHVGNLDHLDHVGHLGGVVILSAEDGLADTIRPRLDAAGADTSKIVAISTVPDREGNERTIAVPEDIAAIEKATQRVSAKLVIIDPLMAFLSGKANYDQDVRKALTPLARMAERSGVAVLVVRHLNKQQGGKALYRGGSSIGIIGAARSGLVVEAHPDNDDLRVLAVSKSNLAEKPASLTYSITTAENNAAKVQWGKATNLNADDILNPDTSEVGKAKAWLATRLRDMPLPATTVLDDAEAAGISKKTLYRAKDALGVESKKDGLGGTWRWHLVEGGQGSQGGQDFQDSQDRWLVAVR